MTGWVGDPATGFPDLPSPPVDGPQPLVLPRRHLRVETHYALENGPDQLRRRGGEGPIGHSLGLPACCLLPAPLLLSTQSVV